MRILIATANAHKLAELRALLAPLNAVEVDSASCVGGMPHVEETAPDFAGNARLKALALRARAPRASWILADDSGLEVDALGGLPGVRSARFAGEPVSHAANNAELLRRLHGLPADERGARFRCVLALIEARGDTRFFEGVCEGRIRETPAGSHGFGYDPLFQPSGYGESFAEMPAARKNRLSHRGRALQALCAYMRTRLQG